MKADLPRFEHPIDYNCGYEDSRNRETRSKMDEFVT